MEPVNEILLRSYDIELTRSHFLREILLSDNEIGWEHFGDFYETNFEIFEQNREAILRENWKNWSSKMPKIFETSAIVGE